ncbi:MAG TPA: 16S rRNA (adenine(1518)-N(6)/adenine(1519)-N(6))-dimethyltransferase RsmA [Chthoniobacteraceae bacterium]|jgi:16S rRNA (adenine1518-N6/adenine1519-N6)-dimethyltransferase
MKLSDIHSTLAEHGLKPTRSLGQNFLHDQNLAAWIVDHLDLQPEDFWVEIGPGLGALTEIAIERSPRGLLIEKDDRLIPYLRERFPKLEIAHADAAQFDIRDLFPHGPVKVLGNLPYYVSSQILFNFLQEPTPAVALVFTLQKELAERLSAAPGTKDYGGPTLLIGRRWKTTYLRTMAPTVFTPVPQVESGVVLLTPRAPGEVADCDGARFARLVKLGFSQRRKQLRKLIAPEVPDWPSVAAHLGVPETVRAEALDLSQWVTLTNLAAAGSSGASPEALAQDVHGEIFDVVDEYDHPTRTATRHEVHTQKLRHRAIHIFVFNRAGELFLQKRSRWKDAHPLEWDSSAAGHVNAGRGYDETARRELMEELGVEAPVQEIGAVAACAGTGWEFVRLYRAEHEGPFSLPPAEIETGGWFTLGQIEDWIAARPQDFATGFLECWRIFQKP